jgi:hypothetical protein
MHKLILAALSLVSSLAFAKPEISHKHPTLTEYDVKRAMAQYVEGGTKKALSVFKAEVVGMQRTSEKTVSIIAEVEAGFNVSAEELDALLSTSNESETFRPFIENTLEVHGPAEKGKVIKSELMGVSLEYMNGSWVVIEAK